MHLVFLLQSTLLPKRCCFSRNLPMDLSLCGVWGEFLFSHGQCFQGQHPFLWQLKHLLSLERSAFSKEERVICLMSIAFRSWSRGEPGFQLSLHVSLAIGVTILVDPIPFSWNHPWSSVSSHARTHLEYYWLGLREAEHQRKPRLYI